MGKGRHLPSWQGELRRPEVANAEAGEIKLMSLYFDHVASSTYLLEWTLRRPQSILQGSPRAVPRHNSLSI